MGVQGTSAKGETEKSPDRPPPQERNSHPQTPNSPNLEQPPPHISRWHDATKLCLSLKVEKLREVPGSKTVGLGSGRVQ